MAAPRNTDNIPQAQSPLRKEREIMFFLYLCFLFLFICVFLNVGLSHRQALPPDGHQQLQIYLLLAKHQQQKENIFF